MTKYVAVIRRGSRPYYPNSMSPELGEKLAFVGRLVNHAIQGGINAYKARKIALNTVPKQLAGDTALQGAIKGVKSGASEIRDETINRLQQRAANKISAARARAQEAAAPAPAPKAAPAPPVAPTKAPAPQAPPTVPPQAAAPQAAPTVPQAAPAAPQAAPTVPQAAPTVPQAAPAAPKADGKVHKLYTRKQLNRKLDKQKKKMDGKNRDKALTYGAVAGTAGLGLGAGIGAAGD